MKSLDRRQFLYGLGTFGFFSFVPTFAWARSQGTTTQKRVIVAGAGLSGLYAADLLVQRGFAVTVLEASNGAGGRVTGGLVNGQRYDFGGQGFGQEMRRVRALGQRFGLTPVHLPNQNGFFMNGSSLVVGSPYDKMDAEVTALDTVAEPLYAFLNNPQQRAKLGQISVMQWATSNLSPGTLDYFRTSFAAEWCASPDNVSLLHFVEVSYNYPGSGADEMAYRFREGIYTAAQKLASGLGTNLKLNAPLDQVTVSTTGLSVRAAGATLQADFLVLAMPLPQLSKIGISGLDTSNLQSALAAYEGAAVSKVVISYSRQFWSGKATDGGFATPSGLWIMDNSDTKAGLYSLIVFLGGPAASAAVGKSALLDMIAQALGPDARTPLDYKEQDYLGTTYQAGGYASNRRPSSSGSAVLPTTLGKRIFLAGSESASEYPTYMEGALEAAERSVNAVISAAARVASEDGFHGRLRSWITKST